VIKKPLADRITSWALPFFLNALPSRYPLISFLFAMVIIVPFCGWAFNCGCTWPSLGLSDHCNINQAENTAKCPWCMHFSLGLIATGGAVSIGTLCHYLLPQSISPWLRFGLMLISPGLFLLLWSFATPWLLLLMLR
jgi:hypothetical protein